MEKKYAAYDLHLHSLWSYDACTPPEYYFSRAKELNLRAFAVTDHHNFDAFEEILETAKQFPGVGFLAGAEMTVKSPVGCFDLVCLGLPRVSPPKLQKIFDTYHELQREWGDTLCRLLQERGHNYTRADREKLLRLYRPERTFAKQGVTHVRNEIQRDYLIAQHYVKDGKEYGELCWKAMSEDDSYEAIRLLEGSEIIDAVHDAGGIVMIAHPAGYFKGMNEKRMDEVLEALPLDGIECAHPSVPEEYTAFYRAYCKKHGLLSSGGTDCHEDPPHAYLKLSEGRDMAWHAGESVWLDEILERVRLWNV
mgnify:FL=1